MKQTIKEQMSALVDDELPQHEREVLLKRMSRDSELRQQWEHYHLIREVLQGRAPQVVDKDFATRVSSAVAAEQPTSASTAETGSRRGTLRYISNLAVAASIAVVAIVLLRVQTGVENIDSGPATVAINAPQSDRDGTRWQNQTPAVETRLNGYLVNHNEFVADTSIHGMLQHVRIASYDANLGEKSQ